MRVLFFDLGCQFTVHYFVMGMLGSLIAVWVLPGCYTTLPSLRRIKGAICIQWGAVARLATGGIGGCIADRNGVNAFFAGFFAWHVFNWLSAEGWKHLRYQISLLAEAIRDKKGP